MPKTSFNIYVLLLLLIPFLNGCVGYNTITKSEPLSYYKKKSISEYWDRIPVYEDDKLFKGPYKVVAKLTVTGDQHSFDKKMIKKMQKEASRFNADAIIFKNWKEVDRTAVNGVAIGVNILTIFSGGYADLDMGGKYVAYEYEGIAIQFY